MAKLGTDAIIKNVAASRPAAGVNGRLFWASDTKALSRDNGSTWDTIIPATSNPGAVLALDGSGDLAFTTDFTQGPTFPGSPADGDKHLRTDLGVGYEWNNSLGVWLGPERLLSLTPVELQPFTTTASPCIASIPDGLQLLITGIDAQADVLTTNDGSNYWNLEVSGDIYDFQTDTSLGSISAPIAFYAPSGLPVLTVAGPGWMQFSLSKVGSPGNIQNFTISVRVRDALT